MTQQLSKDEYIAWLSKQHYSKIANEAEELGFEKPEDQKWSEVVDELAELKYAQPIEEVVEEKEVEEVVESVIQELIKEVVVKSSDRNFNLIKQGVVYTCLVCGEQLRSDDNNKPFCPVSIPECPRS